MFFVECPEKEKRPPLFHPSSGGTEESPPIIVEGKKTGFALPLWVFLRVAFQMLAGLARGEKAILDPPSKQRKTRSVFIGLAASANSVRLQGSGVINPKILLQQ